MPDLLSQRRPESVRELAAIVLEAKSSGQGIYPIGGGTMFDVGRAPSVHRGPKDTLPPPNPGTVDKSYGGGAAANSGPDSGSSSGGSSPNAGGSENGKDQTAGGFDDAF